MNLAQVQWVKRVTIVTISLLFQRGGTVRYFLSVGKIQTKTIKQMFFTFYVPGVFKTRWLTNWIQTNECTKISKINNNNVFEKNKK